MRIPRNLSGDDLVKRLRQFGYEPTRQTGSHLRLARLSPEGPHYVTIPRHNALRIGTLNNILTEIANHLGLEKSELIRRIEA